MSLTTSTHMITRQSPKPVSKDQLEKVSGMLQELPAKPKDELSLKEAIAKMYEYITAALNRGYSHAEISEVLKGQGLQISSSTLKSYLAQVKPTDTPKRAKQPRKAKAEAASEVDPDVASEISIPDAPAASEPPKRGGRKTATSQKTAAKAAAKPATIALDVPVSSEPPKRGRKTATDASTAKPTSKGEGAAAVKTTTRRRSTVGRGRKEPG